MNPDDLFKDCPAVDLADVERRLLGQVTPAFVHIYLGPNITPNDVAEIVANAPPGSDFMVHVDSKGGDIRDVIHLATTVRRSEGPTLAQSISRLEEKLVIFDHSVGAAASHMDHFTRAFADAALKVEKPLRTNQPHGPAKVTRKGKTKRW